MGGRPMHCFLYFIFFPLFSPNQPVVNELTMSDIRILRHRSSLPALLVMLAGAETCISLINPLAKFQSTVAPVCLRRQRAFKKLARYAFM